MIEAAITAARVAGGILVCIYLGEFAGVIITEGVDAFKRWRTKRKEERDALLGAAYRCPPPPPPYRPTAPVTTPPPDKGSDVQPPARWTDPQDEPPPQGCTAEERAEILAALEGLVHTYYISPCKICTNRAVDGTQYPCACCRDGQYFISKWRRDGEIIPDPKHWYPK